VKKGDTVILHITNIERAKDAIHGFAIDRYNINLSLEPGKYETVVFKATKVGTFPFYCTEFCSALHLEMAGYLEVTP
jgi:nitrous-oxide reductase